MEDVIARKAILHLVASMVAGKTMSPKKFQEIQDILNEDK